MVPILQDIGSFLNWCVKHESIANITAYPAIYLEACALPFLSSYEYYIVLSYQGLQVASSKSQTAYNYRELQTQNLCPPPRITECISHQSRAKMREEILLCPSS